VTGFRKRPPTIRPFLSCLALLAAATAVGCGKKPAPAPKVEATRVEHVQSDVLGSVSYDEGHRTLVITFDNGSTHVYSDVPRDMYVGMMATPSRGVYFNTHIKGRYPFQLMTSGEGGSIHIQGQGAKPGKLPRPSGSRRRGR